MERSPWRTVGYWILLAYAIGLVYLASDGWVLRGGATMGVLVGLDFGVPAWHLIVPAYGLVSFILLRWGSVGKFWYLAIGHPVFTFFVSLPINIQGKSFQARTGLELTTWALLVFVVGLVVSLVAILVAMGETVPITAFAARIAYLGRLGHLRELFRLARERRWEAVGPQAPDHSVFVKGKLEGRDVDIQSGEKLSAVSTGNEGHFYWVRIAAKSVLPAFAVAIRRELPKPDDRRTELRGKCHTSGSALADFYVWPQEGQRVSPDAMPRLAEALDRGRAFLRGRSMVVTQPDAILYAQQSGLRITDNAEQMAQLIAWLVDVVGLLERETALVKAESASEPPRAAREKPVTPTTGRRAPVGPTSLAGRALLALLLTVGFYGLALTIAAGLLFLVYADVFLAKRFDLRLLFACALTAGVILWSILPRRDRFEPPGPRLEPTDHPALFRTVEEVARQTGQSLPREVYLTADINAGVTERGGVMGIGSRRVLIVGLPLLGALTVAQVRGVLAHEFGHFYGGDTRLGPWIYKIRGAIGRTIGNLQGAIQAPFRWYGLLFLRTTHAISRRQEFVADRLAASLVGPETYSHGLRAIYGLAAAFDAYMRGEFVPAVESGYAPPFLEGFTRFTHTATVATAMDALVNREIDGSATDPYDTHPSLGERLDALADLPPQQAEPDDRPGIALLADPAAAEKAMLHHLVKPEYRAKLKPASWDAIGELAYLPQWQKTAREYRVALAGYTIARLPELICGPNPVVEQIKDSASRTLLQQELEQATQSVVAQALGAALSGDGWTMDAAPGIQVTLRKGDLAVVPMVEARALAAGTLTPEVWAERCRELNISDIMLSAMYK